MSPFGKYLALVWVWSPPVRRLQLRWLWEQVEGDVGGIACQIPTTLRIVSGILALRATEIGQAIFQEIRLAVPISI
eukprot:2657674-Amphidinium_carterae.1